MNKSLLALVFALPLIAGCFGKKAANNEVVKPEALHEEVASVADEATECNDEAPESSDEEVNNENDEK